MNEYHKAPRGLHLGKRGPQHGGYGPPRLETMGSSPFLHIALSAGSPTGRFRDSAGYAMLLQRSYAAQVAAAKKMDKHVLAEKENK